MVKITNDLISRCSQYLNAIQEFQLDLRGYKIAVIENLSATNDQFGSIDLSDNSISKLEVLPKLTRLRSLLLINNRINSIEKDFSINCSHLENLILTNNKISNIIEVDNLVSCKSIVRLSLMDNLITKLKYYRLYVIYKLPNVRVLDFQKVKLKERKVAFEFFNSQKGMELIKNMRNKQYDQNDSEFIKALSQIKHDQKIQEAIYNMVQSFSNIEDLANMEEKIKTGKIIQEYKEMEINNEDNSHNNEDSEMKEHNNEIGDNNNS